MNKTILLMSFCAGVYQCVRALAHAHAHMCEWGLRGAGGAGRGGVGDVSL